jgi:toxin-antitoxin system PIN domain toxin
VILLDANLLLYAYNEADERHEAARRWLEGVLSGPEEVRLAWVTILAFLRIGTNPRAFEQPLSIQEAVAHATDLLAQPSVTVIEPAERHWRILSELLPAAQAKANLVMDAHLAALAIENGATLCTTDRDFTRFHGLKLRYPLEAG